MSNTREVIEAARDALDSVNRTAPGRLFVVESRDALQALLDGDLMREKESWIEKGYDIGAKRVRKKCGYAIEGIFEADVFQDLLSDYIVAWDHANVRTSSEERTRVCSLMIEHVAVEVLKVQLVGDK